MRCAFIVTLLFASLTAQNTTEPGTDTSPHKTEAPEPTASQKPDCSNSKADIVFVLDASLSVGLTNFVKVLEFAKDILNTSFHISQDAVRASVIHFHKIGYLDFDLKEHDNKGSLFKAIDAVGVKKNIKIRTNTADGINVMNGIFKKQGRPGVARFGIVVTDGKPTTQRKNVRIFSLAAKKAGVSMFAVGVGRRIKVAGLKVIASEPWEKFGYSVLNFAGLQNITQAIQDEVCMGSGATCKHGGKTYKPNEQWTNNCQICACDGGIAFCDPEECPDIG